MKSLILICLTLGSCTIDSKSNDSPENKHQKLIVNELSTIESIQIDSIQEIDSFNFPDSCEMKITSYKSDSARKDSTLLCNEYLFLDQSKTKEGKCYLRFPFELDAMSLEFYEQLKIDKNAESFDPLICEVGGHSAYNKYRYKEISKNEHEVIHYKAWYEDYDSEGNPITYETPSYFIGEKIKIFQTDTYVKFQSYDEDGNLLESLEYFYNDIGFLSRQVWSTYGNEVYLAHYVYSI